MNEERWVQRLNHFEKAVENLSQAIGLIASRDLSPLEEQGLIKGFELVHELAWLTIKDFYENLGDVSIQGSKDAFRLAFKRGLIEDGAVFMKSVKSRQLSVHSYNEETIQTIHTDIVESYYPAFESLKGALLKEKNERGW